MPTHIPKLTRIQAAGNKPKLIDEYIGRVNTKTEALSIAHMRSPGGWIEPAQRPEFDEYTLVLRGRVEVVHDGGVLTVHAGEAVLTRRDERVQYRTPDPDGAEYIAVCVPAFAPGLVHREAD